MENGVGVVERIDDMEVKRVDDDVLGELRVEERVGGGDGKGAHGHKVSDGDEVFEEAVEAALDDVNDGGEGLVTESEVVGVCANEDGDSDAGFSAAEGSSSLVDEEEVIDNAGEGPGEGKEGEGESVEVMEEWSAANSDEGSVVTVDDNGGVTSEVVSNVDERVLYHDAGMASVSGDDATEESHGEGLEVEPLKFEEIKTVDGDEDMIEKSVVMETSVNKEMGEDGVVSRDVEVMIVNGDASHANGSVSKLEEVSVTSSSDDQLEKLDEIKEDLVGDVKDHGGTDVEGAVEIICLDHQANVGAAFEGLVSGTTSENEDGRVAPECKEETLVSKQQEEDSKVEDTPSEISAPVDNGKLTPEVECSALPASSVKEVLQDVAPDMGTQSSTSGPLQSSDAAVADHHAFPKGLGFEGKKTQEVKQDNKVDRETEIRPPQTSNPLQTAVPPTGKSANPTLHPAGLGRAAPLLEPAPKVAPQPRANGQSSQVQTSLVEDTTNGELEEGDEIREKLQMIRVKFLRLAYRLGQTPHNVVVAQVLYRLGLAEQLRSRNGGRVGAFSFDRASAMAEQLEAAGQEPLDFGCTIMVLGKTGVGKSATINSIFDEVKFGTDAFQMGTKKVQDVVGTVQGIKVRVIDTPGLLPSCSDQRQNEKILHSVKRFINKSPPDIVLYLDRLDMPSRDYGDMPLLRTITDIFGPSIWFNAIVVLTHAASAPPEGPNGTPSTYDMFVTQRSHAVQQAVRQAAGDMRLMNPVSLVENHSACRTNRAGQRVLPNGQVWKPHLLLLSFASKILAEANTLLKLQDSPPGKPSGLRSRAPPLPFLLSSLLQSRAQLKLPEEQYGDDDGLDDDLDESSESDEESEYDGLPPFKPLAKAQLAKLTKAQKRAYNDELEYREKLFMKKQLKEERRRQKMMKKMAAAVKDIPAEYSENVDEESGAAASLPVAMQDLALPASFDSDNPTHRYCYFDPSNQWHVRPVLDNHGWDHDVGFEGVNVERMFAVKDKIPVSFSGQVSKDKKEANLQMELASSLKHGEGKATTMGFDMQSVGKEMAYTLRSETRFCNHRRNKATVGVSTTVLGDSVSTGMKLEDKLIISKQLRVVMSGGAMASRGDVAYGGSLEATLRDKDYPLGRFLSTLGLSVMDWHGELALGGNFQSQIPIGRHTNLVARANLNNRGAGQVSLRLNSSEQLQLALIGLLPLLRKLTQRQEHPISY